MKLHYIIVIPLVAVGCRYNATPCAWTLLESSTRGFNSPCFYTNAAVNILVTQNPLFNPSDYRVDKPYRPDPENARTRNPRWVQMSLFRCHTPERLETRQNPVILEEIVVTMNSRGKPINVQTLSNSFNVTDWELQQQLFLGKDIDTKSQQWGAEYPSQSAGSSDP